MSAEMRNPRRLEMDHGGSTCCSVYRRECGGWEPPKGGPAVAPIRAIIAATTAVTAIAPAADAAIASTLATVMADTAAMADTPVTGDIQATADTAIAVGMIGKP
jgi:hypothetical protein